MPIPKTPWFYRAIDKAITTFGSRHNITARQHIAPLIGLTGDNGSIQLGAKLNYTTYNPATPKSLTSDEFIIIMDTIGPDRKIVLDAIAKEYGGVFSLNVDAKTNSESLKDELLTIASFAGSLSAKFLEYKNNDGVIDQNESDDLERIAYETRQHLIAFEEMVKQYKKEKEVE